MGAGSLKFFLVIAVLTSASSPLLAQEDLIHDPMYQGEHPEFRWYTNLVGWLPYLDGFVAGLPDFGFGSAVVSGVQFDETLESPYFITRIDRNERSKFYIGYSVVPGMFSDYRYQSIDYGVFIDSTGAVCPSWDADNPSRWDTSLPEAIYDMRIGIDRTASTMTVEFDSVQSYDSPLSGFTSPVSSITQSVDLTDILFIQMNLYNHYSMVYDVWSVKPTPSLLTIHHPYDQIVTEGDTVQFSTSADYDGEQELIWSFEDPRFERDGDLYRWVTRDGDGGLYHSRLTVTDGRLVDSMTFTYAVTQVYDSSMSHDRMNGLPENPNEWRMIEQAFWYYTLDGYLRGTDAVSWTSAAVTENEVDLGGLRSWVFRLQIDWAMSYAIGLTETEPRMHNGRHSNISAGLLIEGCNVSRAWYSPSTPFEDVTLGKGLYDFRITWDPAVDEARFEAVPVGSWPDSLSTFADAVWKTWADADLNSPSWIQISVISGSPHVYDVWSYVPQDGPGLVEDFSADAAPDRISLSWTVSDHEEEGEFVILRCPEEIEGCRELLRIPAIDGISVYGYDDDDVLPGSQHNYRLYFDRGAGMELLFETGLVKVPFAPAELYQNQPNPFNPGTRIGWYIPEPERVRITIFDHAGRPVRHLVNRKFEAGVNHIDWDGTGDTGRPAASGVYFYRIEAGSFDEAKKMILLR